MRPTAQVRTMPIPAKERGPLTEMIIPFFHDAGSAGEGLCPMTSLCSTTFVTLNGPAPHAGTPGHCCCC